MTEDLHDRLRRIDPLPDGVPVDHITGGDAPDLLEEIMDTEETKTGAPRRTIAIAALAAVAACVVAFALLAGGGGDDSGDDAPVAAGPPLELTTPEPGITMTSCMAIDATTLGAMETAFRATPVSIDGDQVLLDVNEWYVGGDAEQVALTAPAEATISIEGVEFVVGESYLVTAAGGVVNGCGFSGPATPELQAIFDEAFPAPAG